jgi:hypothetical protein
LAVATLLSAFPAVWLAFTTLHGFSAVKYYGWLDPNSGVLALGGVACWSALAAAIVFSSIAWKRNSLTALRTPWIALPLVAGLIGDAGIYWAISGNAKGLWFPLTFFMWPAFAFLLAGTVRRMLPNSAAQSDAFRSALDAPTPSAPGRER